MKKYMKLMGNAVCALSILFVLAALVRTEFDFSQVTDWQIFLPVCAAGVLLKTGSVFLSAGAWCLWLEFYAGKRCDRREALCVYARANIGKYLPGNVMHYVERNLFAEKLEMTHRQMTAASISEILSLVLSAFVLGAVLSFSQLREAWIKVVHRLPLFKKAVQAVGHPVFAAVLLCIAGAALRAVFYGLRRYGKKTQHTVQAFIRTFFICSAMYAAVLLILGAILVCLYAYLGGRPDVRQALQMIAAYIMAWVLGFVIPGAPGGIGVREMVLTLLLTPLMGADHIVVLGVLHRLITVAGDFAAYLCRSCLQKQHKEQ